MYVRAHPHCFILMSVVVLRLHVSLHGVLNLSISNTSNYTPALFCLVTYSRFCWWVLDTSTFLVISLFNFTIKGRHWPTCFSVFMISVDWIAHAFHLICRTRRINYQLLWSALLSSLKTKVIEFIIILLLFTRKQCNSYKTLHACMHIGPTSTNNLHRNTLTWLDMNKHGNDLSNPNNNHSLASFDCVLHWPYIPNVAWAGYTKWLQLIGVLVARFLIKNLALDCLLIRKITLEFILVPIVMHAL